MSAAADIAALSPDGEPLTLRVRRLLGGGVASYYGLLRSLDPRPTHLHLDTALSELIREGLVAADDLGGRRVYRLAGQATP